MSASTVFVRMPDLSAGACRTAEAAEVFREITARTEVEAREICRGCPDAAWTACLEWAVAHEDHGVWAGLGKHGLRNERLRRGIRLDEVHLGEIAPRPYRRKEKTS